MLGVFADKEFAFTLFFQIIISIATEDEKERRKEGSASNCSIDMVG